MKGEMSKMKKVYEAPKIEIEIYELNANIASNCTEVVTMGDYGGGEGEPACNDYLNMVGKPPIETGIAAYAYNINFWKHSCDCYTTAGGRGFFTS